MDIKGDKIGFDYEAFRRKVIAKMTAVEKELTDKDGLLTPLLNDLVDTALSGEMQTYVDQNRPNDSKAKTVKTTRRPVGVEMPRDRDSFFEPKLIGKRHTTLGEGLDNSLLSLYSKEMSYEYIRNN